MSKLRDVVLLRRRLKKDNLSQKQVQEIRVLDKLIAEVVGYLSGCYHYDELSVDLKELVLKCRSPQVRVFDKVGAFRLLGWLLDERLERRKQVVALLKENGHDVGGYDKVLTDKAFDKYCYPGAKLDFKKDPI